MKYEKEIEMCRSYLSSRKEFLTFANNSSLLKGNDNIIGRIGEFIVLQFLEDEDREPELNTKKNEKGYDILCDYNSLIKEKDTKISVKVITSENKIGRTTRIKMPWHEVFIVVLDHNYNIEKIGRLRRSVFDSQRMKNPNLCAEEPYADKKMLEKGGLFYQYGEIYNKEFCKKFLNIIDSKEFGDDGFGFEETPESEDYSRFTSYWMLYKDLKYTHSNALKAINMSQEEYERLYKIYLPELELE